MYQTSIPKSEYAHVRDPKARTIPRWKNFALNVVRQGPIPQHVAIIMDGNRRYAKQLRVPVAHGHEEGGKSMSETVDLCFRLGVKVVTLYAFSIENFKRPREQVETIFDILRHHISELKKEGIQESGNFHKVQLRFLGRLELLPDDIREYCRQAARETEHRTTRILNICAAYTSRDEMVTAMRGTVQDCQEKSPRLSPQNITSRSLTDRMFTSSNPPLDILIRTSGVKRLSDFLLWQCHQDTVIEVVDKLCPEFGMWDLLWIIVKWQRSQQGIGDTHKPQNMDLKAWPILVPLCTLSILFYSMFLVHLPRWLI